MAMTSLPSAASRTRTSRPGRPGRGGRGEPARPAADDRDLDLAPLDLDLRPARRPRHVRLRDDGEWRVRAVRMPHDLEARPAGDLARPDVGDAVHRREAVRAVAGEAQRPAAARLLAGPQDGERHRVARLEGHGRPSTTIRPAAGVGPGRRRADVVGHWRIRVPSGSKHGRGWRRAGRRRPMISISKPSPPGPSGVARAVGHVPERQRQPRRGGRTRRTSPSRRPRRRARWARRR